MKSNNTIIRLALLIIPLALIAAGAGVFWQGTGESYPFETLRGVAVQLFVRRLRAALEVPWSNRNWSRIASQ